jgi:YbbR domain-containing protein
MKRQVFVKLGWQLLALAVALVLWLVFTGSPAVVTSISAPIEYQNMPQELETSTDLPRRVSLEISGPAARVHEADLTNRRVVLNLEAVQGPGEWTFTIEGRHIDLPAGLHLVRAIPAQVRLTFERRVSASVPVRVRIAAPPPEGYYVARQQTSPSTLKIVGPESRVRLVGAVDADAIDLSRTVGKALFQVHAFVADPQVRFASPAPKVEVSISLEKTVRGGTPSSGSPTVRN